VPDLYQGTELWDLSLVDPDNRRPVDYDERRRLLRDGGHPKQRLTQVLLRVAPDGDYQPLVAHGAAARHVLAFARGGRVVTVVPRFPLGLAARGGFGDTTVTLPAGPDWTNVLTGATVGGAVPVATVQGNLAVAVLVREA
jgi:(1->4)-alpha-D-glucan 1-alpha-D-glucosylmutase